MYCEFVHYLFLFAVASVYLCTDALSQVKCCCFEVCTLKTSNGSIRLSCSKGLKKSSLLLLQFKLHSQCISENLQFPNCLQYLELVELYISAVFLHSHSGEIYSVF